MDSQLTGTAYHEAAHAVALKVKGVDVLKVEITTDDSGETVPEPEAFRMMSDDDVVTVALVGMYAESEVIKENSLAIALAILNGAVSDRAFFADRFKPYWNSRADLARQIAHNKAKKFIEGHWAEIARVAEAVLAKPGLPKVLNRGEIWPGS